MSELAELQSSFQTFLLSENEHIHQFIVATQKVPVATRLAIYGHAYRARLLEALEHNYPVLALYLGEEAFAALGYEYIDRYPSQYPSIRWFGEALPTFINLSSEYQDHPYLMELALLEWSMTLVFDAADANTFSIEEMASIPPDAWESMKFQTHPSIHRLNLAWNVVAIWQAIIQDETPPEPQKNKKVTWVLWRKDLINQFCSLEKEEALALDTLLRGSTFGEIGAGLCASFDEETAAIQAATLLKGWLSAGFITEVII